jgi:hypothetical protein
MRRFFIPNEPTHHGKSKSDSDLLEILDSSLGTDKGYDSVNCIVVFDL